MTLLKNIAQMSKLIALGYHAVGGEPAHLSTPTDLFREEMRLLSEGGYTFLQFRDLGNLDSSVRRPVLVYFDDGYKNVYTNAYSVLKELGIKATLFVTTDFIEKRDSDLFLTWEDVKAMQDVFEIGSHGVTHRKFSKLSHEELHQELMSSRKIIQEKIGSLPVSISYPHSSYNASVQDIVRKSGFSYTVGNGRGYNYGPEYVFLKKVPMSCRDSIFMFKLKLSFYPFIRFVERIMFRL